MIAKRSGKAATKRSWIRKNSVSPAEFLRIQLRSARRKTRNRQLVVRSGLFFAATAWFVVSVMVGTSLAEVVRFEVERVEPFAGEKHFGEVGPYERIIGQVYYAIDPGLPQNRAIRDLDLAPRNGNGNVEFRADLFVLLPKDRSKANGAILHDVNNRGNKLALGFFNSAGGNRNDPQSENDAGNGFLMRHGFTIVSNGWDGELLPGNHRLQLHAPVATHPTNPITNKIRCEIVPTKDVTRIDVNWANHGSYRPTHTGLPQATLTVRERSADERQEIARERWTLHVTDVEPKTAGQLPRVELELPSGLKSGWIYELIYEAQDPLVHGVCFAALRDLISALKHGEGEGNPFLLAGKPFLTRAHSFGVSQTGRYLREYLYWGFNEDERGRKVLDGVIPHVSGGGLGSFNHRFAQPTRHVCQHDHHEYPADRFPFAYELQNDPLSKQRAGILERAERSKTAPLVMHTQSEAEYWTRSGSLVHTDPLGQRDAVVPQNVRIYAFGGTQHGPSGYPPSKGPGKYAANPADYKPFLRALLLALDRWVTTGAEPPPSVIPTIGEATLVDWHRKATGFPAIPSVEYPGVIQQPSLFDYGPLWLSRGIIDKHPPGVLGEYKVLVPRCDVDGNVLGCLLPAEVAVPVATHTGWNLRSKNAGAENELVSLKGSYLPFAVTKAERIKSGDPRRSLEERYGSLEEYLRRLRAQCMKLQRKGYLLQEDAARIVELQKKRMEPAFAELSKSQ